MEFPKAFLKDMEEAFIYFKSKQMTKNADPAIVQQLLAIPLNKWIANLLRQPIYELIGEKRANVDEKIQAEGD